jgi:threonine dehydrogenase-like Zn-dependent dehydrogenase
LPVVKEHQVRIQGAATYRSEDFRDAAAIIPQPNFDARRFLTATFPLLRAKDAFDAVNSGQEVKILVEGDSDVLTTAQVGVRC